MLRAVFATILLMAAMPAAAQRDTVNKQEFRDQEPRRTRVQLSDQFLGMFEPVDERRRKDAPEPQHPLSRVMLIGRPYAAQVPGLCRSDTVIMMFAPVGVSSGPEDASTATRAYRLETQVSFHFARPPKGWYRDVRDYERSPWDRECHGVAWPESGSFIAEDDEQATDAFWAVHLAGQAVAAGKVTPICEDLAGKPDCRAVVATFAGEPFWFVEACDAAADKRCFSVIGIDDLSMRVVAGIDGTVDRVEMSQTLTLAHPRID